MCDFQSVDLCASHEFRTSVQEMEVGQFPGMVSRSETVFDLGTSVYLVPGPLFMRRPKNEVANRFELAMHAYAALAFRQSKTFSVVEPVASFQKEDHSLLLLKQPTEDCHYNVNKWWLKKAPALSDHSFGFLVKVLLHLGLQLHLFRIYHGSLHGGNLFINPNTMHTTLFDFSKSAPIKGYQGKGRKEQGKRHKEADVNALLVLIWELCSASVRQNHWSVAAQSIRTFSNMAQESFDDVYGETKVYEMLEQAATKIEKKQEVAMDAKMSSVDLSSVYTEYNSATKRHASDPGVFVPDIGNAKKTTLFFERRTLDSVFEPQPVKEAGAYPNGTAIRGDLVFRSVPTNDTYEWVLQ